MRIKAARYYDHEGPRASWYIVTYPWQMNTEENPHNWTFAFSQPEWRSLGVPTPKRNEVILVELSAKMVGDGSP